MRIKYKDNGYILCFLLCFILSYLVLLKSDYFPVLLIFCHIQKYTMGHTEKSIILSLPFYI